MSLTRCKKILEDCELYNTHEWIDPADQTVHPMFSTILDSTAVNFFEQLNVAILSGEYTEQNVVDKLYVLEVELTNLAGLSDVVTQENLRVEYDFMLLYDFIEPIRSVINGYKKLVDSVSRKVQNQSTSFLTLVKGNTQIKMSGFSKDTALAVQLASISLLNLKIARIDLGLSVDQGLYRQLVKIKTRLEQIDLDHAYYLTIIKEKCEFLIRKISSRFREDKQNYTYAFDFQDAEVQPDTKLHFYEEFNTKILGQYNINGEILSYDRKAIYENIIKEGQSYTFNKVHTLLQFYKDQAKDMTRLENLRKDFTMLCNQHLKNKKISNFDQRAILLNKNYFINNELSLLLAQPETTVNKAVESLKIIETLQAETGIYNYFPYLKICEFISKQIQTLIDHSVESLDQIAAHTELLSVTLEKAFKNLEWCKERTFLAFQLPKGEATLTKQIAGKSVNLFVVSSFILPINYVKIQKDLQELNRKLDMYRSFVQIHRTIEKEKQEIWQMKTNIEKMDKRSIEILGVFAAIVLFASGSIQIFSIKGVTIKHALNWMLCFSYSLVLFIYLLWLITREGLAIKKLSVFHWVFFVGLVTVWIVSLLYTLGFITVP